MLQVSREVASSAKVLLTGDGGDDVFLGYPRHRHLWLAQTIARMTPRPVSISWQAVRRAFEPGAPLQRVVHFLDYATGGLGAFIDAHDGLPTYRRMGLRSEEHTSELQSLRHLVCRLLLEKKKIRHYGYPAAT